LPGPRAALASKAAYAMAGVSIALLALYGADIAASQGSESGFLPLDARTRGSILGGPSIILPIVAYAVSRREASAGLGAMIAAAGALIMAGGAVVMSMSEAPGSGSDLPLLAAGALVMALGIHRMARPRR